MEAKEKGHRCFFLQLNAERVSKLDQKARLEKRSRTETYLAMVRTFAAKHGVFVPPLPVASHDLYRGNDKKLRYRSRHRVAILLPSDIDTSWLSQLMRAYGVKTVHDALYSALDEGISDVTNVSTPHSAVAEGRQRLAERAQLEVYHVGFPDSDLKM